MNTENNNQVLWIIGNEGFIGSNLQEFFSSKYNVVGVSIDKLYVNDDIKSFSTNTNLVDYLVENLNSNSIQIPQYIVYAAGSGSVPLSVEDPMLDFSRNVNDYYQFLNMIGPLIDDAKLIHLSSAAVYGAKDTASKSSDLIDMSNIASPYGMHKYLAEQSGQFFSMRHKLKIINLRIFSVYGKGLKKQIGWDLYNKSLKSKECLSLMGSGLEQRDWISIDDVSLMIESIFNNDDVWSEAGKVLNCGTGVSSTVKDYAEIFCEHFGLDKPKFTQIESSGDPSVLVSNINYEKNILSWEPSISLKNGLADYFGWLAKDE